MHKSVWWPGSQAGKGERQKGGEQERRGQEKEGREGREVQEEGGTGGDKRW